MAGDRLCATAAIDAPAARVFAVLADPSQHAAIDGTGWVVESLDAGPLTAPGQLFRMGMHHDNHPDGDYEIANLVVVFDPPRAIAWQPGYRVDDGGVRYGGWIWRYDLAPAGPDRTEVTLTYDWSAVSGAVREHIGFPPFAVDHLDNSLAHLAALATS